MTAITVIKADQAIYEDGVGILKCDMTGVPEDFWALQWDGSKGHIEWTDLSKANTIISSSDEIKTHLNVSLSDFIQRRNTIKNG